MEDIVVTEDGALAKFFLAVLVHDLVGLHREEYDELGLCTLLDAAAALLNLLEGKVFARVAKQPLIDDGVGTAGNIIDCAILGVSGQVPRLMPRNDALVHLLDNSVGDHLINLFHFLSFFCFRLSGRPSFY